MNHKLAFLLPRAAAITLIAGIGALLLFVVFKLLLAFMVVASVALAVRAVAVAFKQDYYQRSAQSEYSGITPIGGSGDIVPVIIHSKPTIIPVA